MACKLRWLLPFLLLGLVGCTETQVKVQLTTPGDQAIQWKGDREIGVLPFLVDFDPDSLPVDATLTTFFTRELSHYTPQPIIAYTIPCWEPVRRALVSSGVPKDFRFAESAFFRTFLNGHPRLLLFTGKVLLSRAERSQMREEKIDGDKITTFKTVQAWEMRLVVDLLEGGSGRSVFSFDAIERREQEPPVDAARMARSMLDTLTDKLAHRLFSPGRQQERSLLLK